jgi:hypothetical protein
MKQLTLTLLVSAATVVLSGHSLAAQQPGRGQGGGSKSTPSIPANQRPPAGMCRIWLDNVPANQQPAATDCPSAVKNRPLNGRVIFGDDYVRKDTGQQKKALPPFTKSFTNPPAPPRRP